MWCTFSCGLGFFGWVVVLSVGLLVTFAACCGFCWCYCLGLILVVCGCLDFDCCLLACVGC